MQVHEFYSKYANVPIPDRLKILNFRESGLTSLDMVYKRVDEIEDLIRPYVIERDRLIEQVEDFIWNHQATPVTPKKDKG